MECGGWTPLWTLLSFQSGVEPPHSKAAGQCSPQEQLHQLVPALLADANVDVRIAACGVAEKTKAPMLREPVLRALASAREEWLLNAAANAAWALGAEPDLIRVLVTRLDEEGMTADCLRYLASAILSDLSGHSIPTDKMLGVEAGRQSEGTGMPPDRGPESLPTWVRGSRLGKTIMRIEGNGRGSGPQPPSPNPYGAGDRDAPFRVS